MRKKPEKIDNYLLVRKRINLWSEEFFDEDLKLYADNLLRKAQKKPSLNLNRGRSEIWAASIVYTICRLNFLFDKEKEPYISPKKVCDFFAVKQSTIQNKSNLILEDCEIDFGAKEFSKPEIRELFEVYVTAEGFILPSSMVTKEKDSEGNEIAYFDMEKFSRELEERRRELEEEIRARREERDRKEMERKERMRAGMKKRAEEKRERRNRNQLNLFENA